MNRLAGKTAFLAVATSGIGRAAAELFAAEGARVVVAGRRLAEGEEVVNGIRCLGGEAIFIRTDVTEEASIAAAIDQTVRHYGTLNVLLSNAGGSSNKDGSVVEGYIFDRRTGATLADSYVRLFPKDAPEKRSIAYSEVAALNFSGRQASSELSTALR